MLRTRALLLAASVLAPLPALATADPTPGPRDSRIRSTPYDPQQVIRLTSTDQMPVQVIFEEGEKPLTIAGPHVVLDPSKAEAEGWFAKPSGNMLSLAPIKLVEMTMMLVNTVAADGRERHYVFELRNRKSASGDSIDPLAYVSVQFTYKAAPDPSAIAEAQARRDAARAVAAQQVVATRLIQAASSGGGAINLNYMKRDPVGCPLLAPMYGWDDGVHTSLVFAPNITLPEVYVINQDGKEAITTPVTTVSPTGLRVDVPGIYRELRLRRGGKVCGIMNGSYDPVGTQPGGGTGTISPDVVRAVRP